jgi:20S proteasome alpha/beta subunit
MTIALGILAADGAVLAADSEITTPGDWKASDTKLLAATFTVPGEPARALAVAGAGSVNHFNAIRFKVVQAVLAGLSASAQSDAMVEKALTETISDFYSAHVIPFYAFPQPPDVYLLVATWLGGRGLLWATEQTAVRQALDYDAIGIAQAHARELLSGYFAAMPIESAVLLACYVAARVKADTAYCGQETQVIVLREGGISKHLPRVLVQKCESVFHHYADLQTEVFRCAAGVVEGTSAASLRLSAVRSSFDELRQEIKAKSS